MIQDRNAPDISVVVVTADRFQSIRTTMRHLRMQTARERIELIVVAPSEAELADAAPEEMEGFWAVRRVFTGPIDNLDKAAAPGILQASAPIVGLVEDHAFAEPGWAAGLIDAHAGPWGVVGSTMVNANPGTTISWMNLLIAYGRWVEPAGGGEIDELPGHNIAYKRDLLLAYGAGLVDKLGRDGGLLQELQAKGVRFYLSPQARVHHVNPSLLAPAAALRFNAGRLYGAVSRRNRSAAKRLFYFAAGPAVPFVNFWRQYRRLRASAHHRDLIPRVYPALLLGYLLDGAGQMFGSAFGPGETRRWLAAFEFHRSRHVTLPERELFRG